MADVNILIDVSSKAAGKKLQKIEKEFDDLADSAENAGKEGEKSFKLMSKSAAVAAVAVAGVGTAVAVAIEEASKLQDLETQFIAFTGSAEGAADQVERLAEFSGQTPFRLNELVEANRTLLAFGQGTEESIETLRQLGEVSAGTGADLGELALIFGQVEAAGKLTGERFLQFAERGINLAPILAEQLGVAESQIAQLRAEGKITAEDVAAAFESMTTNGGKFEGSLERLSMTFSGASSTLSDNLDLLAADLGKKLLPAATGFTQAFTELVKGAREFTKETKTDRIEAFNNQIERAEENVAKLAQQAQAAGEGGLLFRIFGGDPEAELQKANAELADSLKQLEKLRELREAAQAAPEGAVDDPDEAPSEALLKQVEDAQKISAELEEIAKQRVANEKARAAAANAAIVEQLDEQREIILQKETEKQVALLESQGLFEEAQRLQAEENLRRQEAAEKASLEKRQQERDKANKADLKIAKINADARVKFDQQSYLQRAQTAQKGLAALASLQSSGSKEAFEIGKAAAIAQALVSIPATAIEAYKSLAGIPYVGPALGAAAAAAAIAAGTSQINKIRATKFTAFQDGGVVEGGIPGRDSVPALLTPGEVVVPERNFGDLKMSNTDVVMLLNDIKKSIESLVTIQSERALEEEETAQPLNVELTLDGEVLANQILELNRDNARIA
jgi:tape measure domain-containing protein